jgi:hypothetical protein
LRSSFFARMEFFIFQNVCFQPAPDQADQTRVSYSVLNKAEHPFVTQAPEEVLQVRLQKYLKTESDGYAPNNLLNLKECYSCKEIT